MKKMSVVLIDWNKKEYVDLLDDWLEMDEPILMIRRLMTHKKVIAHFVTDVKAHMEPVTNWFGF